MNVTATKPDVDPPDTLTELAGPQPWEMSQIDPERELAKFEAAAELQRRLIPASIKMTKSQDWVQMGPKVYLQGTGVERIAPLWGLVFGEPVVTRENYDDGTYAYIVRGPIGSRRTGVFYRSIEGARWSGDGFFDKNADPTDVRKAAVTNWQTRGASMLTGLRGLTPEDLKSAGVSGVTKVEYGAGAKGGKGRTANESGVPEVPFGKNKGTPITELSDSSLTWYFEKAVEQLASADYQQGGERYKYRPKEEAWRAALSAEIDRRKLADSGPPSEREPGEGE